MNPSFESRESKILWTVMNGLKSLLRKTIGLWGHPWYEFRLRDMSWRTPEFHHFEKRLCDFLSAHLEFDAQALEPLEIREYNYILPVFIYLSSDTAISMLVSALLITRELARGTRHTSLQPWIPWPSSPWLCPNQHKPRFIWKNSGIIFVFWAGNNQTRYCADSCLAPQFVEAQDQMGRLSSFSREGARVLFNQVFCTRMSFHSYCWCGALTILS